MHAHPFNCTFIQMTAPFHHFTENCDGFINRKLRENIQNKFSNYINQSDEEKHGQYTLGKTHMTYACVLNDVLDFFLTFPSNLILSGARKLFIQMLTLKRHPNGIRLMIQ